MDNVRDELFKNSFFTELKVFAALLQIHAECNKIKSKINKHIEKQQYCYKISHDFVGKYKLMIFFIICAMLQ